MFLFVSASHLFYGTKIQLKLFRKKSSVVFLGDCNSLYLE